MATGKSELKGMLCTCTYQEKGILNKSAWEDQTKPNDRWTKL